MFLAIVTGVLSFLDCAASISSTEVERHYDGLSDTLWLKRRVFSRVMGLVSVSCVRCERGWKDIILGV